MSGAFFGADIGGTFTDIIYVRGDGTLAMNKRLSTPDDFSLAIAEGMSGLLQQSNNEDVTELRHGTTVATNAVLEKTGARTVLVTTRGFRDRLEIGRLRIPRLYDITWNKPAPLVPRDRRLEINERVSGTGKILRKPDSAELDQIAAQIVELDAVSIAVCLINSYLNDENEIYVVDELKRRLPSLSITYSAEILKEIGEYERTCTTTANAYIKPVMKNYLESLSNRVKAIAETDAVYIMQSNGGVFDINSAVSRPVFAIESGPAAGVVATKALGQFLGEGNLLAFDMGGTTAKASLIENGAISYSPELEIGGEISRNSRLIKGGGYLIRTPTIDIAEVGAGGGSIAWVEEGQLRLGPRSAGSKPGPACYDLGGSNVTVTDASLLLGYINPEGLAGGAVKLISELAHEAIERHICSPLGLDPSTAANGIHKLANAAMGRAISSVSTERGRDIRDFVLVAFGGNGPIHAAALAREFDIRRVVIPPNPGLFSVNGLLFADEEQHFIITPSNESSSLGSHLLGIFDEIESNPQIKEASKSKDNYIITSEWFLDLRYLRQGHAIRIAVDRAPANWGGISEQFEREHEVRFGHRNNGCPIEVVNVRLVCKKTRIDQEELIGKLFKNDNIIQDAQESVRFCDFGREFGLLKTVVLPLGRGMLGEERRQGPMIIEEYDSSIVVPPDFSARRDKRGVVWLENSNLDSERSNA